MKTKRRNVSTLNVVSSDERCPRQCVAQRSACRFSREEALARAAEPLFERARGGAQVEGGCALLETLGRFNRSLADAPALRQFVEREREARCASSPQVPARSSRGGGGRDPRRERHHDADAS
jgi:hypothetical protein